MEKKALRHFSMRAAMLLLVMVFTSVTASASIKTVTYTYTDQMRTQGHLYLTFTATGDVNASYQVEVTVAEHSASFTLGDIQVSWASNDTDFACGNFGGWSIGGKNSYTNWTFTISSDNYYIDNVKYFNQRNDLCREQTNVTKSCTITTNNQAFGGTASGIHAFTVVMSDSPAYKLRYMVDGSEVSDHGNPAYYESAVGATLTSLSKTGYNFDGWYDNDGYTGSTISSIAAGTTGEKTLYARWSLITYNITYELNEGHFQGSYRTSYNVTTNTFDLLTPSRDGYYFRGWFEDEDFAGRAVTQVKQGSTGDRTFYAKWEAWEAQGNGTKWNPYKISSEADLRALATKVNGGDRCQGVYYQQTCDITITGGDWTPIGTQNNYFAGNYDGGNFTISGVNINSTSNFQGLFGKVVGTSDQHYGLIQNIILENSTIAGGSYTGGIVGRVVNAHVHNCHVRSVTVQAGANSKESFGGVVGYFRNGTIKDCTSMATVNKDGHSNVQYFGGAIGYMEKSSADPATATNCFSYGMKPIGDQASGSHSGTATNVERVYRMRCTDGSVSLPDEVSATDGFYYDGKGYYKKGASIPLTLTIGEPPVGYDIVVTHTGNNVIMPNEDGEYVYTVETYNKAFSATTHVSPLLGWTSSYTPDGTTNPYVISTTDGWNLLCDALQDNTTWNRVSGKTVKLGADITVSRMAGSQYHDFCGTFDGDGHTLTVNISSDDITDGSTQYVAPFRYVSNTKADPNDQADSPAAIRNLNVAGTITTAKQFAGGLIGGCWGNVSIENCAVSTAINSTISGAGGHGGIVGIHSSGTLTITGCVFDGSLLGTTTHSVGGFIGYRKSGAEIRNSLFAPAEVTVLNTSGATFARNKVDTYNSYYTRALGTAQGTAAYVYTPATASFVPANVGAESTGYSVSGITAYATGLKYDGKFYLVKAEVSLADNADNSSNIINKQVADVTLTGRTLTKDGNWNTLCLPFSMTAAQIAASPLAGATIKEMATTSNLDANGVLTLKFNTVYDPTDAPSGGIEAGKPYIIKWTTTDDDIVNPVFSNVTISSTTPTAVESYDHTVTFVGQYSPFSIVNSGATGDNEGNKNEILLMTKGNKIGYSKNPRTLNCFRCHFYVPTNGGQQAHSIEVDFGEGETTSLSEELRVKSEDVYYTLDGRKLEGKPTAKGMYIVNGRKVIIK